MIQSHSLQFGDKVYAYNVKWLSHQDVNTFLDMVNNGHTAYHLKAKQLCAPQQGINTTNRADVFVLHFPHEYRGQTLHYQLIDRLGIPSAEIPVEPKGRWQKARTALIGPFTRWVNHVTGRSNPGKMEFINILLRHLGAKDGQATPSLTQYLADVKSEMIARQMIPDDGHPGPQPGLAHYRPLVDNWKEQATTLYRLAYRRSPLFT